MGWLIVAKAVVDGGVAVVLLLALIDARRYR